MYNVHDNMYFSIFLLSLPASLCSSPPIHLPGIVPLTYIAGLFPPLSLPTTFLSLFFALSSHPPAPYMYLLPSNISPPWPREF